MCSEETLIQKDTHTPMFIAAPDTITKIWKQYIYINSGMDEEDVVHIYSEMLHSWGGRRWNDLRE